MALKPEFSLGIGLASATLVYGIYQNALPTAADERALDINNEDLMKAERTAAWLAAGTAAGVSLIARDKTVFIIGGGVMVGLAWMHRHAAFVNPVTKVANSMSQVPEVGQADAPEKYNAPTAPEYDQGSF